MKTKTVLLCTVALCLGGLSAHGQSVGSGPRYTPRAEVANQNYTETNRIEDRMDVKSYEEYELREPCQSYRALPRNYTDKCNRGGKGVDLATVEVSNTQRKLLPVVHSYTVLFDFDKSAIRSDQVQVLDQLMRELDKYDPRQITVTGYTDTRGTDGYNQTLSRQREEAVSKALLNRGIKNHAIDREARGEYSQAVKTPNDTKNQENRRVVIDFRR